MAALASRPAPASNPPRSVSAAASARFAVCLAALRTNSPSAAPNSAGRPSPSPCQNGNRPGCPNAGVTSTRSKVISSMRQLVAPRANTSPTRDS
ncbi:Uncharacterised protein [Mycobacteroides abscessus subsp. abscessus]|nr:Uncharacterised protein [Mycobacteroides abscessus subsp. abscessus]